MRLESLEREKCMTSVLAESSDKPSEARWASSDLVVSLGELRDICCPCGDIGVSTNSSSGRLGNQVSLGVPVDDTLASLGVPGLDRVTCSFVFSLSGFVPTGFFVEK